MSEKTVIRKKKKNVKYLNIFFVCEWMRNNPRTFIWETKYGTYKIIYENNQLQSVTLRKNPFIE